MCTTTSTSRTAATRGPTLGESGSTRTLDRRPHGGSGRATQTDPNCELMMSDEDAYMPRLMGYVSFESSTTPSTTSSGAAIRGRHRPACSCPWTSSSACQSSAMASPPPREQGVHAAGVDDWLHRVGLAPGKGLRQRAGTRASGTHWLNTHAVMMEPCFVIASSPPTSRIASCISLQRVRSGAPLLLPLYPVRVKSGLWIDPHLRFKEPH